MFQFSNASPLEIQKLILKNMLLANDEVNEALKNDEYFEDVAKIGALLSDERMCVAYCERLNDSLIHYAKRTGNYKKMADKNVQHKLKPSPGFGQKQHQYDSDGDDLHLLVEKHKQYKVLSGFLSEFEASHKFNEGSYSFESKNKDGKTVSLTTANKKAITLPGFAAPNVFRENLLAKARHFKDPTVGVMHGEFTHRIQWYIVCEYARLTKQLTHSPADIFKACARPIFVGMKSSVWDIVFEGSPSANDFKKPEKLTEFLLRVSEPTHVYHKKLWFLAGLTEGRFAKRRIEKGVA